MRAGIQRIISLGLVAMLTIPGAATAATDGRERNEQVVANLPRTELQSMRRLEVISGGVLERMDEQMSGKALRAEAASLKDLGPWGLGSREIDGDDRAPIHHYLRERLEAHSDSGLEILGSYRGLATVPVKKAGEDPYLEVAGERIEVFTVHPNGPMPSLVPEGGLAGPLVEVGTGDWESLRGKELKGSICLMDFRGGRNWERLYSLGARAVVVLEDQFVKRTLAEELFTATPIPFPRYYAESAVAERLRELARSGESGRLHGGDVPERRPYESWFAYLPPTEPVTLTVTGTSLLEFLAVEAGLSLDELLSLNPEAPEALTPGDTLILPGGETYTVEPNDLLERLSARYGITAEQIRERNQLEGNALSPGTELEIPNFDKPMVVTTRVDSVSAIPHAPHGGLTVANLAVTLRMLDFLAGEDQLMRRRGVIFGFLDGDLQGGLSSRGLTEYLLRDEGAFAGEYFEGEEERVEKYRQVENWLSGDGTKMAEWEGEAGRWFVEEWLGTVVEKFRVETAEERVEFIKMRLNTEDPAEEERLQGKIDVRQAMIDAIAGLRDETILNGGLPMGERAISFLEHPLVNGGSVEGLAFPIQREALLKQFRSEKLQLERNVINNEGNRELIGELRRVLGPENEFAPGYYFDFSDGSQTIGLKLDTKFAFRQGAPFKVDYKDNFANRLRDLTNVAAVTAGWEEAFNFYSLKDNLEFAVQAYEAVPYYPSFWQTIGVSLLPLGGLNDGLVRLDTPHDTIDRLDFENLAVQGRTGLVVVAAGLESALDSAVPARQGAPSAEIRSYGLLTGKTLQFNIRSGIDAQEPVPGTTLFYPAVPKNTGSGSGESRVNTFAFRGARMGILQTTFLDGSYTLPLESIRYATALSTPKVFAFTLDS